ncbi:hypothetical protein [Oxalobacter formigenes]|nr:hypothetical protein [Oxalobacter formigenes]
MSTTAPTVLANLSRSIRLFLDIASGAKNADGVSRSGTGNQGKR